MSTAALYLRISDDRQGDAGGVTRQRRDCLDYCAAHDLEVRGVYEDNDISASAYTRKARPAYRRMLAAAAAGEVDAIVTWHLDRLYRRPRELEDLIDLVEARAGGLSVRTVTGGDFDLSSADGRAMARVMIAVAAKASDDASRRIRRKHLQLAEDGKPTGGGSRPFGFERDRRTVREPEAHLIRDAAARVLAGDSLRAVADAWTAAGVPTVTGARAWRTQVVRRILMSPRIAGLRGLHGAVVAQATWPAIIAAEQHEALRALLSDPRRLTNGGAQARSYLLTGIALCGICGARLHARPRADRTRCYVCAGGVNFDGCGGIRRVAEPLEEHVRELVLGALDGDGLSSVLRARAGDDARARELMAVVRDEDARLERMKRLLVDGDLAQADWRRFRGESEARIADAQRALARHVGAAAIASVPVGQEALERWWEDAHLDRRRAVLGLLVERVVVHPARRGLNRFDPTRVEVRWRG